MFAHFTTYSDAEESLFAKKFCMHKITLKCKFRYKLALTLHLFFIKENAEF